MSLSAVVARVQALEGLVQGSPAPPAPAPGAFAAQLAGASGASASAAAPAASPGAASPVIAPGATSAPGSGTLAPGTPFAGEIEAAAAKHGIDPALLAGLIRQESGFKPDAVSHAGARGLTQLMPGTAAALGVRDPSDPVQAIEGGAKYLREQLDRFGGDVARALAAYNAGPGAVERFGGVPPYAETQNYVRRVQAYAAEYRGGAGSRLSSPIAT